MGMTIKQVLIDTCKNTSNKQGANLHYGYGYTLEQLLI